MISTIQTRVLVLSDTHGPPLPLPPTERADVAIHCGDLTEESKLQEYRTAIRMIQDIEADLKLVIAGNHDWTLDDAAFRRKVAEMKPTAEDLELVERKYGCVGDAKRMLVSDEARAAGIVFLEEGTHSFDLANRARLTVYASPYTPSLNDWAFSYDPREEHSWSIGSDVNVAITHSPPKGVLDYTFSRQRAGSQGLFAAVAKARPQMHCFGHIHEAWGAKLVKWIDEPSAEPSHFSDIDHEESSVVESLASLRVQKFDEQDIVADKAARRRVYGERGYCIATAPRRSGRETLFVNASVEGEEEEKQWPWLVDLELPKAGKAL